jgi:hypothetical protein
MNISVKSKSKFRRAYVPTTALAKAMEFEDDMMHVFLTDGRIISVPIFLVPIGNLGCCPWRCWVRGVQAEIFNFEKVKEVKEGQYI